MGLNGKRGKNNMENKLEKIKIIFVPGNGGDGNSLYGWFFYLKNEFEKMGLEVLAPVYPDPALARAEYWLPFIEKLGLDEKIILVGHSSRAIAIMKLAEKYKILGSVLVSAYYTGLGLESEKLSGYFNEPFDWETIRKNQNWIIQFNSTDDPFIPIAEAHFVHKKLNSDYHELTQGHFSLLDTFPELVEAVKSKLK